MQIEHEEDRPSEPEQSRDKTGPTQAQPSFAALLQDEDPVQTRSVEQGYKNQDKRTEAKCHERFEFIRNLSEECRNVSPAVSRAVSHEPTC